MGKACSGRRPIRGFGFVTFQNKEVLQTIIDGEHYLNGNMTKRLVTKPQRILPRPARVTARLQAHGGLCSRSTSESEPHWQRANRYGAPAPGGALSPVTENPRLSWDQDTHQALCHVGIPDLEECVVSF